MKKIIFTKKDIIELVLILIFVIIAIILRNDTTSILRLSIFSIIGIIGFPIFLIIKYNDYSLYNKHSKQSIWMYIWSTLSKWVSIIYISYYPIMHFWSSSNNKSISITTPVTLSILLLVLIVPYIIVVLQKKNWKEAIIQAVYLLLIPFYFLYI